MTHNSTLRNARGGSGLENIPFEPTEEEALQMKLDTANQFEALSGLPIIQARGRAMIDEVKQTVNDMVNLVYGVYDLDGDDFMDYKRSIHDGVSSAIWFESIEPLEF